MRRPTRYRVVVLISCRYIKPLYASRASREGRKPMSQPCDEGVIKSKAAAAPCAKAAGPWILAATILGSSMVFIDGTVVNVALPALQTNLNATVVDVQWVVE